MSDKQFLQEDSVSETPRKKSGFILRILDVIERVGNALPDPLTLFVLFAILVVIISYIVSVLGVSVIHPGTKETIHAVNLLSADGFRRMLGEAVKNFAQFPPLGLVLVVMIGVGVAERSGMISAALRQMVSVVPKWAITSTLVFAGVMSSLAADAGIVILPPLGAMLFAGLKRHPIAGLAAAFAGVSGGFSANLFLTALDPLLSGLTEPAAQIIDPSYTVAPTANYYFMIVSTVMLTVVGTFVTTRFVEPRLGTWNPDETSSEKEASTEDKTLAPLQAKEKKGLLAAGITFLLTLALMAFLVVPENALLRDAQGGLKPFYDSLVMLLTFIFLFVGLAYGIVAKTITSDKDVAKMTGETMATMGAYIVLAFAAAQFISYFSWSNLGLILAVKGAGTLKAIGFEGTPLLLGFIIVAGLINLFIASSSAKWAIMAPIFVPMLMLMGYSPEAVQLVYRLGDSITNIITPLMPYFPIIIAFAHRYDRKAGLGTLISSMVPYSVAFGIFWMIILFIWLTFGFPLGPDAPIYYTSPSLGTP